MPVDAPLALPIARVALDVSLPHLDRPFDYAVTPAQDAIAVPGARVRVRFSGRLRDGFVLERRTESEHDGPVTPIAKVVSGEPVLTAETAALVRAVADHYAGTFADVVRLAVPPRHAATEQAAPAIESPPPPPDPVLGPWPAYPGAAGLLSALGRGDAPRAYWQLTPSADPTGDWALGLAAAARATVDGGRSAVLVVPDRRDLARLRQACEICLGPGGYAVLDGETGPAARYRAFLAAVRGQVRVVIGNRAAAYAPVRELGLLAMWDDGDDLLAEQRAPYPHAREVLALRAAQQRVGLLLAGYGRTAEVQSWIDRDWLRVVAQERTVVRHTAPRIRVSADSDAAVARDPVARVSRLPHEVFELVRASLPQGPVLVQVPRAGHLLSLVCASCREPARCGHCAGPLQAQGVPGAERGTLGPTSCRWCGRRQLDWECPICGSHRVRAPVIGAERTAEELGRAFPQALVRASVGGRVRDLVSDQPAIVVATPGAEPRATGGYAGAVLLDTAALLLRPDLRAAEEALRRWLTVVALVRGGDDGGTVVAVGESSGRALQALVRIDPAGFAERELRERAEAHFPPVASLVRLEGSLSVLAEVLQLARWPSATEVLGPVEPASPMPPSPMPPSPTPPSPPPTGATSLEVAVASLTVRVPRALGPALVRAVKDVTSLRSARKSEGGLRVRVDPEALG